VILAEEAVVTPIICHQKYLQQQQQQQQKRKKEKNNNKKKTKTKTTKTKTKKTQQKTKTKTKTTEHNRLSGCLFPVCYTSRYELFPRDTPLFPCC
jgi:Ni/Co efflux regulator RcnB